MVTLWFYLIQPIRKFRVITSLRHFSGNEGELFPRRMTNYLDLISKGRQSIKHNRLYIFPSDSITRK